MLPPMPQSKSPIVAAVLAAVVARLYAAVAFVVATWKARRNRRSVWELLHVDDHMLADIGLTRGDVTASLAGPALDDPSSRLRILAVERRAARRAQVREWLEADTAPLVVDPPRLRASV